MGIKQANTSERQTFSELIQTLRSIAISFADCNLLGAVFVGSEIHKKYVYGGCYNFGYR